MPIIREAIQSANDYNQDYLLSAIQMITPNKNNEIRSLSNHELQSIIQERCSYSASKPEQLLDTKTLPSQQSAFNFFEDSLLGKDETTSATF